jgi:glycosyltransferase involved in cell wall biosynthesis
VTQSGAAEDREVDPRRTHVMRVPPRRRVVVLGAKGFPEVAGAGGVERGVEHLTACLTRLGVSCVVYERASHRGWRRRDRTVVRQLPFLDRKNHALWSHALLSALDYLAHRRRDDVIHVHNIGAAFLCPLFRALGHRVVFHLHGREWRARKWGRGMALFMKVSVLPMLLGSHVVVSVCRESCRVLGGRFPWAARRIVHVPNGLPEWERPSGAVQAAVLDACGVAGRRFFLYGGRLVPQKRVELAIQALRASGSDCVLVVAGGGSHSADYVDALEAEVRRCGLGDRVRFVGYLRREQLQALYLNCRAVVLPSDSEGCSNTLLEAIASEACVVCTDLPENRAVLGAAGLYVPPGDAAALARTLRALEDGTMAAERRGLVAARRRFLASWDDVAVEFLGLYWPLGAGAAAANRPAYRRFTGLAGETGP